MQEILFRTDDAKVPLCDQEFYELRLDDLQDGGYCVREARARWSDELQQALWDRVEAETFITIEQAKACYAVWRQALVERGFNESDTDF